MDAIKQIWLAPAKINWFLHVIDKRADGYHNLQTLLQLIDYCDELQFSPSADGVIQRSYEYGFSDQQDLCLRAAHLLRNEVNLPDLGVTIGLTKKIPIGAGLGGGSSDAATTLLALNSLWKLGLSDNRLLQLALQLGADVPFFVAGHSAWAEGIGERLTEVNLPTDWILVVCPNIHVSTASVFSQNQLTPPSQMLTIRALKAGKVRALGENQFEPVVRKLYPEVDEVFEWLSSFGGVRMSGTGGAVYLRVQSFDAGMAILRQVPENASAFVAKAINKHPLCHGTKV